MFSSFNPRAIGLAELGATMTIELASRVGFEGVDLMVRDIFESGDDPTEIRSRMDRKGIRPGAFPFPIDWRKDEFSFHRGLKNLPPILEVAKTLGLTRTGTWVMPELPDRLTSRSDFAAIHLQRLGEIARMMADFEIRIGLEVIGVETFRKGQGDPFVARMGDLKRELGAIWAESPNLGILLDCFHLYAADEPIEAGLAWGADKIVWVHVADLPADSNGDRTTIIDADRGLPGDNGAVDVQQFLAGLAHAEYDGPVTVEPLANCRSLVDLGPLAKARRVKQSLDQVWPSS